MCTRKGSQVSSTESRAFLQMPTVTRKRIRPLGAALADSNLLNNEQTAERQTEAVGTSWWNWWRQFRTDLMVTGLCPGVFGTTPQP